MGPGRERDCINAFVGHSGLTFDRVPGFDAGLEHQGRVIDIDLTAVEPIVPDWLQLHSDWTPYAMSLMNDAQQLFQQRNTDLVAVQVGMNADYRERRDALVQDLATLVDASLRKPRPLAGATDSIREINPHPSMNAIAIHRLDEPPSEWHAWFVLRIRSATAVEILNAVKRKESMPKFATRRSDAQARWLLIDCDVHKCGFSLDPPRTPLELRTSYDRVFCIGFGPSVIELKTSRAAT